MSKLQTVDYVRHYAFALRNADPESYAAFIQAFEAYAKEITVAVTEAPAVDLLNIQGRAKQTLVILNALRSPCVLPSPQQQPAASS